RELEVRQELAMLQIPDLDLAAPRPADVGRGQGEAPAVGAERHARDSEAPAAEVEYALAGRQVPDAQLARLQAGALRPRQAAAAGGEHAPVGAEGEGVDRVLVRAEVELLGARQAGEVEPFPAAPPGGAALQVAPRLADVQRAELQVGLVHEAVVERDVRLLPRLLGAEPERGHR